MEVLKQIGQRDESSTFGVATTAELRRSMIRAAPTGTAARHQRPGLCLGRHARAHARPQARIKRLQKGQGKVAPKYWGAIEATGIQ